MGIYIHGMEMPDCGYRTVEITFDADGYPMALADGGDVFDVIPVPPHGRLIDADKLGKSIQAQTEIIRKWGIDELTEIADLLEKGFLQEVENADTIIPADPEEGATSE